MKDKKLHKNKGGFKIPKNYFEDFEARLSEKLPSSLPEKDGFKVPDYYFDSVADRVLSKINEDTQSDVPVIRLKPRKRFYYIGYAVAAGLALLVLFTVLPEKETKVNWKDIASTDIESYIEEGYLSLNAYDYATIYEDVDLSKIEIEEDPIESEELMDYLYENINSYENLIIEN